jgi:hypothetical protein
MYSATVLIKINSFNACCYAPGPTKSIDATLSAPQDISPGAPTGVFSTKGSCICITVPYGYQGSVQLIYQLPDPRYVLLGAMFGGPNGGKGAGRLEFRSVSLQRDLTGSQMIVTDACLPEFQGDQFQYVILVQEVASGNLGIIDPDIETDETEPPVATKVAASAPKGPPKGAKR